VVALLGPRQCGKTTLARRLVPPSSPKYFDLEDPASLTILREAVTALSPLRGLVVIDEIQRRPDLFPVLRVLADRRPLPARFLILGSASPELLRQSSETLAGRIEVVHLTGFTLDEVGESRLTRHWLRGGLPPSYLARSDGDSVAWRKGFVNTFLERDLPQLGASLPAAAMHRFWSMVAHAHGSIWSSADPARSLGVSEPTIRRWLDALTGAFMVRQLQPWFANLAKRQVKSPKVFIRDSGLLHQLLGIRNYRDLLAHPKSGASYEGYAIEALVQAFEPDHAHFWATHQGAELDLLLFRGSRRVGFEIKREDAPRITPSMRNALADLHLHHLFVVYPGDRRYSLSPDVTVSPLPELLDSGWKALPRARRPL
jgi:predicted AAA+ superfamily ATPase